jgi:hypothetical protein
MMASPAFLWLPHLTCECGGGPARPHLQMMDLLERVFDAASANDVLQIMC